MNYSNNEDRETDWTSYYKKPFPVACLTRTLTKRKILKILATHNHVKNPDILELGGANSSFATPLTKHFDATKYLVVDNNQYGLDLMHSQVPRPTKISATFGDALSLSDAIGKFDIVFSVGLIEHFKPDIMRSCISTHFQRCRPGGIVLVTFPTPTVLYWMIRKPAEWMRVWAFPDENPQSFDDVSITCDQHGQKLQQSINWMIGLTQA